MVENKPKRWPKDFDANFAGKLSRTCTMCSTRRLLDMFEGDKLICKICDEIVKEKEEEYIKKVGKELKKEE